MAFFTWERRYRPTPFNLGNAGMPATITQAPAVPGEILTPPSMTLRHLAPVVSPIITAAPVHYPVIVPGVTASPGGDNVTPCVGCGDDGMPDEAMPPAALRCGWKCIAAVIGGTILGVALVRRLTR